MSFVKEEREYGKERGRETLTGRPPIITAETRRRAGGDITTGAYTTTTRPPIIRNDGSVSDVGSAVQATTVVFLWSKWIIHLSVKVVDFR
ncbi:hypothetical protein Hdeb2414_s0530g00911941 [Helianthus debilis subsp. tardiflorus]